MRNKMISLFGLVLMILSSDTHAALPQAIDRMFYSEPYYILEAGIYDGSKRHSIYSYIIANMTTPGFDPMKYLPADDQAELRSVLPDKQYSREVLVEFIMTKMAENNRKETALMTMWKNKKDGLQRVVTLGK